VDVKPGYKQTEVGVIPEDWEVTTVGAEFVIQLGKMLDSEKNYGILKPYLGNRAVQWGNIDLNGIGIIKMTPSDIHCFRLREGDLLVCEGGEVGRAAIWNDQVPECYYQKALHRLRPIRGYNVQLMQNMLHRLASTGFLLNFVTQTSIAHLPKDKFEKVQIPLPPTKAEQSAIAAALSDVDALLAALDRLIAKKRDIKQAAMQELLTGKRRLPGFGGDWEVKHVGEFTDCTAGGTPSTKVSDYWGGDIRWMNSGELNLKIVAEVEGRITDEGLHNSSTKMIPANCVLIGLAGQGKTRGTVAMNLVPLCTNQSIAAILPNPTFVSEYLYYNLDARYDELRELSAGDGGRGGLNLTIIRSIVVPFPLVPEQIAIASVLSDMDAEIAALETRREKTGALKQGMMQELLTGRIRLA
jgi:type I restriction enzyme S subunit